MKYSKFNEILEKGNRTAGFKDSAQRRDFVLQNGDGSSHEKKFSTFLEIFESLQFSKKKSSLFQNS